MAAANKKKTIRKKDKLYCKNYLNLLVQFSAGLTVSCSCKSLQKTTQTVSQKNFILSSLRFDSGKPLITDKTGGVVSKIFNSRSSYSKFKTKRKYKFDTLIYFFRDLF